MDEEVPLLAAVGLALLLGAGGVLVAIVSRRAADARLGRNAYAGVRTTSTMRSDAAWRAGHAAAVPLSDSAAVVFVISGLAALLMRQSDAFPLVLIGGSVVGTALLLVAARKAVLAAAAADQRVAACPPALGYACPGRSALRKSTVERDESPLVHEAGRTSPRDPGCSSSARTLPGDAVTAAMVGRRIRRIGSCSCRGAG